MIRLFTVFRRIGAAANRHPDGMAAIRLPPGTVFGVVNQLKPGVTSSVSKSATETLTMTL